MPVTSEALASLGYDPASRLLEVEFTNGRIYQYSGVPQHEVERLLRARSRGAYFSERLRDHYPFEQVA